MMKLIADSSANLTMLEGVTYQSVPMTIRAGERDFVDDETLDTHELLDYLAAHNGKSGTACPSLDGWLKAFEGADEIFVITIFDTLSTGPEMQLLAEKLAELHAKGLPFDVVCEKAQEYLATTHLFFSLKSLHNLAQNGRVSKIAAGAIGILGIHILATASLEGTIQPVEKCRGEKKTCAAMVQKLLEADYHGGKVRIHHAENPEAAGALAASLRGHFPEADIEIRPCRGLCSYYAERGGVIVGFETM